MTAVRAASEFAGDALAGAWNQELPGTSIEIVLELAGTWELDLGGQTMEIRAFAAGMLAGPVRSRPRGAVRLVQLAVDPLVIPALFGMPAGEIAGIAAPIDALLGTDADRLLDELDSASNRAAAAEEWATNRVAAAHADRGPLVPADVQRAVGLIHAGHGARRIESIAHELGCSRRHLARRFAEWIGVSPSEYRRLVRFEQATDALRADPLQPLGRLAADCGYADHAHMDRDFGVFAAATPSAVAARFV